MRILLIMPDAHMHKLRIGSFIRSMREAPLTLTTLAGLPVGYLSGLRLEEPVRNGRILGRGYQFLRERHGDGRVPFYQL